MSDDFTKAGLSELLSKLYQRLHGIFGDDTTTTEGEKLPAEMMEKEAEPGEAGMPEMLEKEAMPGETAPNRFLEMEESKITPEGQEDLPTKTFPPQAGEDFDEDFDEERKRWMRESKYTGRPGPGTGVRVALGAPAMPRPPQRRRVR